MPVIEFSELPQDLRVKLLEDTEKELWHRIDEFGGIKEFTQHFEYSKYKMYNWKNKNSFLPVNFVQRLMGSNNAKGIKALKGKGRSKAINNPEFPLKELALEKGDQETIGEIIGGEASKVNSLLDG